MAARQDKPAHGCKASQEQLLNSKDPLNIYEAHEDHRPLGFEVDWKCLCDKIDSVWSSFDFGLLESPTEQWYLIPVKKLYIRPCYKSNLEGFILKRDQLNSHQKLKLAYIGTSGISRSGFLQTLLVYLVHDAKSRGVVYSIRLSVFQSERKPPED